MTNGIGNKRAIGSARIANIRRAYTSWNIHQTSYTCARVRVSPRCDVAHVGERNRKDPRVDRCESREAALHRAETREMYEYSARASLLNTTRVRYITYDPVRARPRGMQAF